MNKNKKRWTRRKKLIKSFFSEGKKNANIRHRNHEPHHHHQHHNVVIYSRLFPATKSKPTRTSSKSTSVPVFFRVENMIFRFSHDTQWYQTASNDVAFLSRKRRTKVRLNNELKKIYIDTETHTSRFVRRHTRRKEEKEKNTYSLERSAQQQKKYIY